MDITTWSDKETELCIARLADWRIKTFREQEDIITSLKNDNSLAQSYEEIRFRFNYLDKLTNNEFSTYQLFTIPPADKKYIGCCLK